MDDRPVREPVLVTGATGFIGRRLVARLAGDGLEVRALVHPGDPTPLPDEVRVLRADVRQREAVREAVAGSATVFHLAAVVGDWAPRALYRSVTVEGTRHVLDAAEAHHAAVVLVSSVVVYGDRIGKRVCDEQVEHGRPQGLYSWSKQQQERLARDLSDRGGRVVIVRPTNVFGPGGTPWVDELVVQLRRRMPVLIGGGDHCAGLVYVDNVVELLRRAGGAFDRSPLRIYNACDEERTSWRRYVTDLARAASAPPPRAIPRRAALLLGPAAEQLWRLTRRSGRPPLTREALNLVAADHRIPIDRARRELSYRQPVSYAEAMREVASYLAARS